jgi:hypothetical protein
MSSPIPIQIFGERCSGTNYLELLLRANFISIDFKWDYGGKHFFHKGPIECGTDCIFIVIYRDPFDWLRSFHRKPHHSAPELKHISFSQFIRKEWRCLYDEKSRTKPDDPLYNTEMLHERDPDTGERFTNVMRLRSAKLKDWELLKEKAKNTLYIKYEALRDNPEWHVDYISKRFDLPRTPVFWPIVGYKGRDRQPFRPKVYPSISSRDIDHIVNELDADLELRTGYDIAELANQQKRRGERYGVLQIFEKFFI